MRIILFFGGITMEGITEINEAAEEKTGYTAEDAAKNEASRIPTLVVDDGTIEVPIHNKQGQPVGKFIFSPTDMHLFDRYNKVAKDFEKIIEPLEHVNINPDGSTDAEDDKAFSAMQEATQRLYSACDYLFGGNMSEAFFGKVHPFSPVGGKFYCENVLEAVGNFISDRFGQSTRKLNRRAAQYLHGANTRTSKHKAGK